MLPVLLSLATVICSMFMPPTGGGRFAHRAPAAANAVHSAQGAAHTARPMVFVMTSSRQVHGRVLAVEHALMLHNAWMSVLAEGNDWGSETETDPHQYQYQQQRATPAVHLYQHPADGGGATCCLCLEGLSDCRCAKFGCSHSVHERCYHEFLQKTPGALACPLCRTPL
jgi:hypothetical protein